MQIILFRSPLKNCWLLWINKGIFHKNTFPHPFFCGKLHAQKVYYSVIWYKKMQKHRKIRLKWRFCCVEKSFCSTRKSIAKLSLLKMANGKVYYWRFPTKDRTAMWDSLIYQHWAGGEWGVGGSVPWDWSRSSLRVKLPFDCKRDSRYNGWCCWLNRLLRDFYIACIYARKKRKNGTKKSFRFQEIGLADCM